MNTSLISAVLSVWLVTAALGAPTRAKAAEQTTPQIQHLIVIIQENTSFDHYFATYPMAANPPGEPAFTPLPGTPSINGLTPGLIHSNPNSTKPFRLDRSRLLLCN